MPVAATSRSSFLSAVSCVSPSACTAVGAFTLRADGTTPLRTLIESWDGAAWKIVPSPNRGFFDNQLQSVSCVSATSCVAVGYYLSSTPNNVRTLVESWDGSVWTIVPSPNRGPPHTSGYYSELYGVSCVSPTNCTAVGPSVSGAPLVESWNGTAWKLVGVPRRGGGNLVSVSCVSPGSCTAVGNYYSASTNEIWTLVEASNGAAWKVVPSPNLGSEGATLSDVSCVSATACTAVGVEGIDRAYARTIIESWNGTAWSIVPGPNRGAFDNWLSAVSCTSTKSCTAVGYFITSAGLGRALIVSWNGTAWRLLASPNQSTLNSGLSGVSCVSAAACAAVGHSSDSEGKQQTLIESWNGTVWSIVPSPN